MRSHVKLGKVFGIPIGLHFSWFLIALLISMSLFQQLRTEHAQWPIVELIALAIITALLFFVSLLLHELAHSLYARSHGLPVREITLFALGGVSQMEGESPSPKVEFWMALVGPLSSLAIGLVCLGAVWLLAPASSNPAVAMLSWLGYINVALAVFNMIPGYPLDGGRVFRAAVWWKTGEMARATHAAATAGQIAGGVFIALGISAFFSGAGLGGLWISFIGWFLLQAAGASEIQATLKRSLESASVRDVMTRDCPVIDSHLSVQEFVDEYLLRTGRRCYVVSGNGRVEGLITAHDIREIPKPRWPFTVVEDAMRSLDQTHTIKPDAPLSAALELMGREDINQLPVVSGGSLEGVLSRADVLGFVQTRKELKL